MRTSVVSFPGRCLTAFEFRAGTGRARPSTRMVRPSVSAAEPRRRGAAACRDAIPQTPRVVPPGPVRFPCAGTTVTTMPEGEAPHVRHRSHRTVPGRGDAAGAALAGPGARTSATDHPVLPRAPHRRRRPGPASCIGFREDRLPRRRGDRADIGDGTPRFKWMLGPLETDDPFVGCAKRGATVGRSAKAIQAAQDVVKESLAALLVAEWRARFSLRRTTPPVDRGSGPRRPRSFASS